MRGDSTCHNGLFESPHFCWSLADYILHIETSKQYREFLIMIRNVEDIREKEVKETKVVIEFGV